MKHRIGIRYEDKYLMERRVALVPAHVKQLVEKGIEIQVVPSAKRVFKDDEYRKAGAVLREEPLDADVVLGVKEMPIDYFQAHKTYIFFSHTIKGQPYNMPLLRNMMEHKINLIDYERIVDAQGRRLIFFGRFAGLAGTINSLWSLGQRLKRKGLNTPFLNLKQTHHYDSLEEAKAAVSVVGQEIALHGLPAEMAPVVVGVTGYGNVSKGAQEILALLPSVEISPADLLKLANRENIPSNVVYKVIFEEKHLGKPKEAGKSFDLQEYYHFPERFEGIFEQYLPHLTVLMNCMYWDDRYPRIVTKDYLETLWKTKNLKLEVIGDVTCDPDGSVEITHKGTAIEDPVFVYNPETREPVMGFDGDGVLVMAVDILPSELPREASQAFSDALIKFLPGLLEADFEVPFDQLQIPDPLKKAMILYHGELTPDYKHLEKYLNQ
jgi:alpha-aminoadipic semialdehyde synthase